MVNKEFGYAGTTGGAFIVDQQGYTGILDFKTCKTVKDEPVDPRDSWPAQIAAYHVTHYKEIPNAYNGAKGLSIAISTTEPGRVEAIWYSGEQLETEWKMFYHLNEIYKLKTGHDPRNFTATKA